MALVARLLPHRQQTIAGNEAAIPNSYEAILIQLVAVFLTLGVPVLVCVFFPWSRASQLMAWGVMDGARTVTKTTQAAAQQTIRVMGAMK